MSNILEPYENTVVTVHLRSEHPVRKDIDVSVLPGSITFKDDFMKEVTLSFDSVFLNQEIDEYGHLSVGMRLSDFDHDTIEEHADDHGDNLHNFDKEFLKNALVEDFHHEVDLTVSGGIIEGIECPLFVDSVIVELKEHSLRSGFLEYSKDEIRTNRHNEEGRKQFNDHTKILDIVTA